MADKELESFIMKFKSLSVAGLQANLHAKTINGIVSINLMATIGTLETAEVKAERFKRGPSYMRRQERRRNSANNAAAVFNNKNIEADRTNSKCDESNATVDRSQDNITHNENTVEIENNNDVNSDSLETAEEAVIVTDVQSVKGELADTHLETDSVEPEKNVIDNEIIENESKSESLGDSSLIPLKEVELESGVNQKAHVSVCTPAPSVVTIHATAVVEKSPHTMFVEEEWDSLIRFI